MTLATIVASLACGLSRAAAAGEFDPRGAFSFDERAVVKLDLAAFTPAADGGSGGVQAIAEASALSGPRALKVALGSEGHPIALDLPATQGSYRLSYWMKGDCTGGAAVDYDDGTPGTVSAAFPTGRATSDGWIEMSTQPFIADGTNRGIDARMFLAAYDASKPVEVLIDAVEVVPEGTFATTKSCSGLDAPRACGAGELCVSGLCRDARGWFPPLPSEAERALLLQYWRRKIRDTFGPYALRRTTLPDALSTIDQMAAATDNVGFWARFAEAVRRLRDAHTYVRVTALEQLRPRHPLNACFFQGVGDVSQSAAPSVPGLPDVLVSHTGASATWGLAQGDRLVAVDGEHPLTWARRLLGASLWYWEADDPDEIATGLSLLRDLIERHASSITVVSCGTAAGVCDAEAKTIRIATLPPVLAADVPPLVRCDNRPFFGVDGAPEDHDFGAPGQMAPERIVAGSVRDAAPDEKIHGLVWNSLFGNGNIMPVDTALRDAVGRFGSSRGVLLDHREGRGGTTATANILVSFARTPFTPFVRVVRNRVGDEGPVDATAGLDLFNRYQRGNDRFGSADARTEIPVAMLMTRDVSASDFLLLMLQGSPKARLFGPGPSAGAFGTFMEYSSWGVLKWSIGIEDAIAPDGTTLCAHGVVPDEIVLPKQSDLLAGKDTVHGAAMAWLRTELAP